MSILTLIIFTAILALCNSNQQTIEFTSIGIEEVPFLVIIYNAENKLYFTGVLISRKYVLASADPYKNYDNLTIHLGYQHSPKFSSNYHYIKGSQIIEAKRVQWHEDFGQIKPPKNYIYDLVLIELSTPASFSKRVQPVTFPSRNDFPLTSSNLVNLTKFNLESSDGTPEYVTVQIRNPAKCELFFGNGFLSSEEFCVKASIDLSDAKFNNLPVVRGNKLFGLGRSRLSPAECLVTSRSCNYYQIYTCLSNSLDWIYENSDVVDKDL